MVRAAYGANGTTRIVFIRGRINEESDVGMLAEKLLSEVPVITSGDYLFQQHNANYHVSRASRS